MSIHLNFDTKAAGNIKAVVVADSVNPHGHRLMTYLMTYPRFIHSELMTHRVLSRNSSSSRAIPIRTIMKEVLTNPALPVYWGGHKKGMQAGEELTGISRWLAEKLWRWGRFPAVALAFIADKLGLHKQISNRLMEPWMYMTVLVSATEWTNFFKLRLFNAQPEFMVLARKALIARTNSVPVKRKFGEWHFPDETNGCRYLLECGSEDMAMARAAAKAARTSYTQFAEELRASTASRIHDAMARDGHMSPFEHTARAVEDDKDCGNFKGWCQYRKVFPNEAGAAMEEDFFATMLQHVLEENPELEKVPAQ